MILQVVYHLFLSVVDILLLWAVVKRPPTSLLRLLNLSEQILLAAPVSALTLSWFWLGKTDSNLAVHGLAWHGSFFLFSSAFLIYRQKVNNKHRRIFPLCIFFTALLYFGTAFDALVYEPTALQIRHLTLYSAKITKPVKIVFLADIQTDNPGWYERRALQLVKEQKADLILFGGDYIQGEDAHDEEHIVEALNVMLKEADLQAPLGVFAVDGNHEFGQTTHKIFSGTAVQVKQRTSSIDAGELRLTFLSLGSSVAKRTHHDYYQDDRYRIIIGHTPIYAMAPQDADLLLAGHTHGGQVQIPFYGPPITHSRDLPRRWASGVTAMANGAVLLVSNGIGIERGDAPLVRFCCRPDFWVIELVPEKNH
ncbi:MAG: metallophosphoesterase [Planctomycetaceae bacterium]|jgi:predicted MPP superfamily phosphohydrolase|nr:metallophosphoesterase [Planctomycetaceae bacterium]